MNYDTSEMGVHDEADDNTGNIIHLVETIDIMSRSYQSKITDDEFEFVSRISQIKISASKMFTNLHIIQFLTLDQLSITV